MIKEAAESDLSMGDFTWLATAVYSDQEEVILCSLEVKIS